MRAATVLARLVLAITGTCCDIWYTFRPPADSWQLLDVPYAYRHKMPLADGRNHRGEKQLPPDYGPMIGCSREEGGCGAHIGAPCVTADGKVTRCHKIRSDTARRLEAVA